MRGNIRRRSCSEGSTRRVGSSEDIRRAAGLGGWSAGGLAGDMRTKTAAEPAADQPARRHYGQLGGVATGVVRVILPSTFVVTSWFGSARMYASTTSRWSGSGGVEIFGGRVASLPKIV